MTKQNLQTEEAIKVPKEHNFNITVWKNHRNQNLSWTKITFRIANNLLLAADGNLCYSHFYHSVTAIEFLIHTEIGSVHLNTANIYNYKYASYSKYLREGHFL